MKGDEKGEKMMVEPEEPKEARSRRRSSMALRESRAFFAEAE